MTTSVSAEADRYQLLVPRAVAGDDGAFVELVALSKPVVFRWAMAMSGDFDEAEDITQEVFVIVHRKLASYRGDGAFEGWLYRVARRVLTRSRRNTARAGGTRLRFAGDANDVYTTDPGARVDQQRAAHLIRDLARALPLRQREVFMLCDLDGHTPAHVAGLLGLKDVSVRANLFKARSAIRREILVLHPQYREYQP